MTTLALRSETTTKESGVSTTIIRGAIYAIAMTLRFLAFVVFAGCQAFAASPDTTCQLLTAAREPVRRIKPDLVIIAVPGKLGLEPKRDFHKHDAWIMNGSLAFGKQEWEVVVALPSTAQAELSPAEREHEAFARRVISAQDLSVVERSPGETAPLPKLLTDWLVSQSK